MCLCDLLCFIFPLHKSWNCICCCCRKLSSVLIVNCCCILMTRHTASRASVDCCCRFCPAKVSVRVPCLIINYRLCISIATEMAAAAAAASILFLIFISPSLNSLLNVIQNDLIKQMPDWLLLFHLFIFFSPHTHCSTHHFTVWWRPEPPREDGKPAWKWHIDLDLLICLLMSIQQSVWSVSICVCIFCACFLLFLAGRYFLFQCRRRRLSVRSKT